MENKKGSEIFLGVIGVATLIVAIIGATFAYFSADARSGNEAINTASTQLDIAYSDDEGAGLHTDLIPTEEVYAIYSATNEDWLAADKECKDDNENTICSTYTFTVGNPNTTTEMEIEGYVFTTLNQFTNLKFAVYDEAYNRISMPQSIPTEANGQQQFVVELDEDDEPVPYTTTLLASKNQGADFDPDDLTTYDDVTSNFTTTLESDVTATNNIRTYKMIIWIEETFSDQTDTDAGKVFAGGVTITTLGGEGVTGIISVAKQQTP